MWTIIKINKKKFNLLKKDFENKTGEKFIFYKPKLIISKYLKNKLVNQEFDLLGDYIFCFNKMFEKKETIENLKFSVGLKYFLNGYSGFQEEIKTFVVRCKKFENPEGCIDSKLFDYKENQIYQFLSGPFVKRFFKILNFNEKKLKILLGGFETHISKNRYFFRPA